MSSGHCATIIGGGRTSVDQATFVNSVLVRYPDLLDIYLTRGALLVGKYRVKRTL